MKNKFLYVLMIIAIILGAVVFAVKGFNYDVVFSKHQRIEIVLDEDYKMSDMKDIVKKNIKSDSKIYKSTLFGTSVIIETKDVSDEELTNLISKINEKYGMDLELKDAKLPIILKEMNISDVSSMSDDDVNTKISEIKEKYGLEYTKEELSSTTSNIKISDIDKINLYDVIRPYLFPVILSIVLVLVYFGIRYFKLEKKAIIKEPVNLLFKILILQLFLISVVVLTRIPFNNYVIDCMVVILILQIFVETYRNEKRVALKKKAEDQ